MFKTLETMLIYSPVDSEISEFTSPPALWAQPENTQIKTVSYSALKVLFAEAGHILGSQNSSWCSHHRLRWTPEKKISGWWLQKKTPTSRTRSKFPTLGGSRVTNVAFGGRATTFPATLLQLESQDAI